MLIYCLLSLTKSEIDIYVCYTIIFLQFMSMSIYVYCFSALSTSQPSKCKACFKNCNFIMLQIRVVRCNKIRDNIEDKDL